MIRKSSAPLRVALLAGGDSPERAVSLASGRSVAQALFAAGHGVTCIDPHSPARPAKPAGRIAGRATSAVHDFQPAAWADIEWQRYDACFLALHGGAGEDGRIQKFLGQRGVACTGPSAESARLAMSKCASKERFRTAGLPTPAYVPFDRATPLDQLASSARDLGYPLISKPDGAGSSFGVSLVAGVDNLAHCVAAALQYDGRGLLERYIAGREFTVAIVGRRPLPLLEIVQPELIFSYFEKYTGPAPHCSFETGLPRDQERAILDVALGAAAALETDSLVRVDLRLDAGGQPWVLELNAIPGMTEVSLAPAAARRAGFDMPGLCDLLLRQCLAKGTRA
jgi:D-alanine-D-alanine ligase